MSSNEALQAEVARLRLEVQALQANKGMEKITVGNYLLARLAQLGVRVSASTTVQ